MAQQLKMLMLVYDELPRVIARYRAELPHLRALMQEGMGGIVAGPLYSYNRRR